MMIRCQFQQPCPEQRSLRQIEWNNELIHKLIQSSGDALPILGIVSGILCNQECQLPVYFAAIMIFL
ncbi:hypothetical protein D3C77_382360 [compost metagenome]